MDGKSKHVINRFFVTPRKYGNLWEKIHPHMFQIFATRETAVSHPPHRPIKPLVTPTLTRPIRATWGVRTIPVVIMQSQMTKMEVPPPNPKNPRLESLSIPDWSRFKSNWRWSLCGTSSMNWEPKWLSPKLEGKSGFYCELTFSRDGSGSDLKSKDTIRNRNPLLRTRLAKMGIKFPK